MAKLRGMLRSLSARLVLSHVAVAVMVLVFALLVSRVTFRQYLVRSQLNSLTTQGEEISHVMSGYFTAKLYGSTATYLVKVLQSTLKDRVYVVDNTGQPLLGPSSGPEAIFSQSALRRVLIQGKNYRNTVGDDEAEVGVPVRTRQHIWGGVFLTSPLEHSNRTADTLTSLLILGEAAAVVLAAAFAYGISRRLSKPLENLRETVAEFADGRHVRAQIEGPSEVQGLADEFNQLQDRIEGQIVQLHREAESRDALMAHVAHDLRTPLTSIRGFLEAIQDGVATGEQHDRAVAIAWEETLRLKRLVDRLLTATRIRSGAVTKVAVDVTAWIQATMDRMEPVAAQRGVGLVWKTRQGGTLLGVEDYLVEALMNLLDNAIKWTSPGSVVTVDSQWEDESLVVTVADRGPGVPEELLPHVFDRFVTGDKSRTDSSGLGLSIVSDVMRQHGGSAHIRNREGGGTIVTLTFGREVPSRK